jgi:hypothetical protein
MNGKAYLKSSDQEPGEVLINLLLAVSSAALIIYETWYVSAYGLSTVQIEMLFVCAATLMVVAIPAMRSKKRPEMFRRYLAYQRESGDHKISYGEWLSMSEEVSATRTRRQTLLMLLALYLTVSFGIICG